MPWVIGPAGALCVLELFYLRNSCFIIMYVARVDLGGNQVSTKATLSLHLSCTGERRIKLDKDREKSDPKLCSELPWQ